MERKEEAEMLAALTVTIDEWLNEAAEVVSLPYVGDNVAECMATAALAVLRGIADTEKYLQANDLLEW